MKTRASILMILWTVLLVEPISANLDLTTPYSSCPGKQEVPVQPSCSKSQSSCSKSKSQPADKDENDC
ncbi:MAG TPA: hypothetical protein VFP97_17185, partial [Chitinophagaceae bacterium]|nr:hypothetical protein [Chitinophagaceae bacterium]